MQNLVRGFLAFELTDAASALGLHQAPHHAAAGLELHLDAAQVARRLHPPEQGRRLFLQKRCARCHGPDGTEGRAPRLVSREGRPGANPWSRGRILPIRSPYATTVWDYINRAMPLGEEGTLTADEVYALTAYLLSMNGVIAEDAVMDAESLPMVQMPNRDNWAHLPDWQPGMPRLPGYAH